MKCPLCENVRMREVVKEGVTIDVCPDCKGVWLDRGELDKLMQGVREMRSEVDGSYSAGTPAPGSYLDQLRNNGGGQPQGGPPAPNAGQPQSYGSQPPGAYGNPQHGSYGSAGTYGSQPAGAYGSQQPGSGNYGSQQQPPYGNYGSPQHQSGHNQYGSGHTGYGNYGNHKYGHGYPHHKKKKSVLDVLGDLFD